MKTMLFVIISLVLLSLPVLSTADTGNQYFTYGAGTNSCGQWNIDKGNSSNMIYTAYDGDEQWLLGYISALDFVEASNGKFLPKTDGAAFVSWMDDFCKNHPLIQLDDAAQKLLDKLNS